MNRWKVLPSTMSYPSSATSAACSPLTVAVDASGTNAGVRTSPCGVNRTPARAEPSRASMRCGCSGTRLSVLRRLLLGGRALEGLAAVGADRDPARLALLGLRNLDLEHALVERRVDLVRVHALGQRQRAAEAAERALEPVPALLAGLVLGLALARDGERAVLNLDRHVVIAQPRKVGLEDEVIFGLDQIHGR